MKYLAVIMIAASLLLVSCGSKKNDNKIELSPEVNCGQAKGGAIFCLPQAKWTVVVLKDDFPTNIVFKLNDSVIIDECSGRIRPFNVMRGTVTNIIAPKFNSINDDQNLKVEIIDKGSDCLGNKTYYLDNDQLFHVEIVDNERHVDLEIY